MLGLTILCFTLLTSGCSSSGTGTNDTGASTSSASTLGTSSWGCDWMGSYCYDFDGSSWTALSAEIACDQISANATAGGAPAAVFVPSGCPGGATAECTGIGSDISDPGSAFTIYYYDAYPLSVAQKSCVAGGGTYTEL